MALRLPKLGSEHAFCAYLTLPSWWSMIVRIQKSPDMRIRAMMNDTDTQQLRLPCNLMFDFDAQFLIRKGHRLSYSNGECKILHLSGLFLQYVLSN